MQRSATLCPPEARHLAIIGFVFVSNSAGPTGAFPSQATVTKWRRYSAALSPIGVDRQAMKPMRIVWFSVGLIALCLGAAGLVLPLLPTTPFVLLAAFAFAQSSERWHDWLVGHRVFGPMIEDWRRHGAIGRRSKAISTLSMAGVFGLSVALDVAPAILAVQGVVLTASAAFVLSRPSPP